MPSRNDSLDSGASGFSPAHVRGAQLREDEEHADDGERDARHQRDPLPVAREQVARNGQDRHRHERDDAERRDAGEQAAVEAERRSPAASDDRKQAGDAAEQDGVAEQRADDRDLDDLGQVRLQREDRDRELGDVAEARLHDAHDAVRQPAPQRVGALRNEWRDEQEREGRGDRPGRVAGDRVQHARDHRQKDAGDQDRVAADHFWPVSVASSASAIARIGWPVRCEAAAHAGIGVGLADALARHQHALGALDDAARLECLGQRSRLRARVGQLGAARLGRRDRGQHVVLPERLDEVAERARLAGRLHDVALGEGRHHDDRHLALGEDLPGRLDTVELGHADVHEHHVRFELVCEAHRLDAVSRLAHDLKPGALEQLAEVEADDGLVLANQHAHPRTVIDGVGASR